MHAKLEYKVVTSQNGQCGYVQLGQGRPLLMLVGYSGNLLHWNSELIYKLAENYTLYLLDNRLVGKSCSTNPNSIAGLATDTLEFIQALGLERPFLAGWSMGGIIAQAVAYQYEEFISGLILIVSQPDHSYTTSGLHQLVANLRENPGRENRERLSELFFSALPDLAFRKYLAKAILPIQHYVYPYNAQAQELQDVAVASWQADPQRLAEISLPSLIFSAKNDQVVAPGASLYLHQLLAKSKLISYSDGGHFFLHHYPRQLAQDICCFLAEIY